MKYKKLENTLYTLFPYELINNKAKPLTFDFIEQNFPLITIYYKRNEEFLRNREKGKFNNDKEWFLFSRNQGISEVEFPKIMTREISLGCNMTYDEKGEFYHNTKVYSFVKNPKFEVDDKFYLAILNSNLMWFFIKNTGSEYRGGYFVFKTNYLKPFPLPEIPKNSDDFIAKAEEMLQLNKDLQEVRGKFVRTIQRKFEQLEKLTTKLENWYLLSFAEFVKELKKKKIKLSLSEETEWEDFFLQMQEKAIGIQTQITQTDKQIDTMVYELYGLSEEEIKIVES